MSRATTSSTRATGKQTARRLAVAAMCTIALAATSGTAQALTDLDPDAAARQGKAIRLAGATTGFALSSEAVNADGTIRASWTRNDGERVEADGVRPGTIIEVTQTNDLSAKRGTLTVTAHQPAWSNQQALDFKAAHSWQN